MDPERVHLTPEQEHSFAAGKEMLALAFKEASLDEREARLREMLEEMGLKDRLLPGQTLRAPLPQQLPIASAPHRSWSEIISDLKAQFAVAGGDDRQKEALTQEVLGILGRPGGSSPPVFNPNFEIPADIPFWDQRLGRQQKVSSFLEVYYQPLVSQGLAQFHIRNRDPKLYNALHQWLKKPGNSLSFDIPTRKQVNDRRLEAIGVSSDPSEFDAAARERVNLHLLAHLRDRRKTHRSPA